jgi:hypothetical protein
MKNQSATGTRLVGAMLVIVAIIGLSGAALPAPAKSQNFLASSLKSIQTDTATVFYASVRPSHNWFVEEVLPTSGSKAAKENVSAVAATL